jgi:predicted transcriptional regulator
MSDGQIAEYLGVSQPFVSKMRRESTTTQNGFESPARTGRDGRTINTANIGKGHRKKSKAQKRGKGIRISRNAHTLKLGHSDPCPMIPMQFSPNNPKTAAATLWQHFSRSFIETLIAELTQRLSEKGDSP